MAHRLTAALAAALLTVGLTACGGGGAASEQPSGSGAVPDVVGMTVSDAQAALLKEGYTGTVADEDGKLSVDNTLKVLSQDPAAGSDLKPYSGTPIKLTVPAAATPTPTPTETETPESEPADTEQATTGGLKDDGTGWTACDQRGEQEFPYGFDAHWVLGLITNEYLPDSDEWYYKVEADVTNEYGAEQTVNVECYVTGTEEAPVVNDFIYY
jgi:hypothetical protein